MIRNIFLLCLVSISCALGEQKIAGGALTTISQYPFAAALLTNRAGGDYVQACGGTIITQSAILSAASCFYTGTVQNSAAAWRARVGSSYRNSQGTIYIINRFTIHEGFSPTTLVNDIAVLRTTWTITYSANVQPARIAGAAYNTGNNQEVWAIGWGAISNQVSASDQLRHVQVWTILQQTCVNRYAQTTTTINDNMICAGFLDVGLRGQCTGDVGGPLLDPAGIVVGVFSRTQGCADDWYPDVNTRVSSYTNWIVNAAIASS
ncbi:trypsin, alkaline A-like [Trichoplusia ni]|uniref:Trypsin, alkaline A-like n=1 Tax=Trichoplusia ni TaxID=7111 RepID=A0A7E5W561_TRINI|nr:trypsin, alkaline A-like [Trichoplusia ni]